MAKKKSEHYVNNRELLEALIVYRAQVKEAKENDLPKPRITNYLGSCFLKMLHICHINQTLLITCFVMI